MFRFFFFFFKKKIRFCFTAIEQSQLDDKDRTIRIQQNLINKLEADMDHTSIGKNRIQAEQTIDMANTATQTDRVSKFFSFEISLVFWIDIIILCYKIKPGATLICELWRIE